MTTTEAKHTPTPWRWVGSKQRPKANLYISTPDGYARWENDKDPEEAANAAHIVHCVNLHDELVAALKALVIEGECVRCGKAPGADFARYLAEARAILAKAKGGAR